MTETRSDPNDQAIDVALEAIREALSRMAFGEISIIVHDSRVVQFDVTEKRRLAR